MIRKLFFSFLLFIFFLTLSPRESSAVTLIVTNIPATISASPFFVTVSIYGANVGKNYLRVDLFKDGTTNYFGETYNGSEWYTGSVGTSYFPIDIVSSTATATADVQAQIGSPSDTDYSGSGAYKLRIRRYTSSSGYSAGNPYSIFVDVSTPTPTVVPTTAPVQTSTPTSTPTKTPTPTPQKTSIPTPTPNIILETALPSPDVLGIGLTLSPSPITTSSGLTDNKPSFPIIAIIFVGVGTMFICLSGYLAYKIKHKIRYNENTKSNEKKDLEEH